MTGFRLLLAAIFIVVAVYTVPVVLEHGLLTLLPTFFSDMSALGWPGQFNLDFMCMLLLSGFYVAWRHRYSPAGLALGVVAFFGGAPFLTAYLLYHSFQADGDVAAMLLGRNITR